LKIPDHKQKLQLDGTEDPTFRKRAVAAALSMFAIAETEHARSEQLDNPESVYSACADMKLFNQEVLRVILLDTRYRHISTVEITKLKEA
jgi:DNA repair protein RadC